MFTILLLTIYMYKKAFGLGFHFHTMPIVHQPDFFFGFGMSEVGFRVDL